MPVVYGHKIFDYTMTLALSIEKPGTVLEETENWMKIATIDYDLVLYYDLFEQTAAKIIKHTYGTTSAAYWWLRNAGNTSSFNYVGTSGSYGNSYADITYGVALGFCI